MDNLPITNNYIDDLKAVMNWLNDRHPHMAPITLIVFNLCAVVAIPFMLIGLVLVGLYKIVTLPFSKGDNHAKESHD
jgi:hypothetical protein